MHSARKRQSGLKNVLDKFYSLIPPSELKLVLRHGFWDTVSVFQKYAVLCIAQYTTKGGIVMPPFASFHEIRETLAGSAHHGAQIDLPGRYATHEAAIHGEDHAIHVAGQVTIEEQQRIGLFLRGGAAVD